jgi:hypothetical protein
MSDNVTTALQVNATTGNGVTTLVLPEPRLVTFKITGNGPVSAGAVTLECCPQAAPDLGDGARPRVGVRGSDGLDNAHDHSRSSEQGSGIHRRRKRVRYFQSTYQHAGNRRNCYCPSDPA